MKSLFLLLLFPLFAVVLGQNASSPIDSVVVVDNNRNVTESPPLNTTPRPAVVDVVVGGGGQNVTSNSSGSAAAAASSAKEEEVVGVKDGEEPNSTNSTTTTVAPPTTTLAPPPSPSVQTWKYGLKPNVNCIQLTAAVQFHIGYETNDGKIAYATFNAPENGSVSNGSQCGNRTTGRSAVLLVDYEPLNVTYTFAILENDKYALAELKVDYDYDDSDLFPNHRNESGVLSLTANRLNETFSVSDAKSYRCDVQRSISFVDPKYNATLEISSVKFVAFSETADGQFGDAEECSDDFTTSDIVPIAVGCALAALVVIVLIAYLIGRRRSRQKGYQSV